MAIGNQILAVYPGQQELLTATTGVAAPIWAGADNARHGLLAYDDTTREIAIWKDIVGDAYDGGDCDAIIKWLVLSGSFSVTWDIAFGRVEDGNKSILLPEFLTPVQSSADASAPVGELRNTVIRVTSAQMDLAAVGDAIRVQVGRVAGGVTDDAYLWGLELVEAT